MTRVAHTSGPTVAEVDAIAAMANPVLRNLEITECYADLSAAMRARTGDSADWCTFATWASRQAGGTIRGEDFLDTLNRLLVLRLDRPGLFPGEQRPMSLNQGQVLPLKFEKYAYLPPDGQRRLRAVPGSLALKAFRRNGGVTFTFHRR